MRARPIAPPEPPHSDGGGLSTGSIVALVLAAFVAGVSVVSVLLIHRENQPPPPVAPVTQPLVSAPQPAPVSTTHASQDSGRSTPVGNLNTSKGTTPAPASSATTPLATASSATTTAPTPSRAPVSTPAPEPTRAAPAANPDDEIVYVTRTGEKYHRDGCRYLSRSRIPMRLGDARKMYGPCSVCRPPL